MAKTNEEKAADKAEAKAEKVDEAVNKQAQEAAKDAEKKSKDTEIAAGQIWEEAEHENPFQSIMVALVDEVRLNHKDVQYVRFSFAPKGNEPSRVFEAVDEKEFRERFPIFKR
jgi:predicted Holliday junction resolvase-like endonuclease